MTIPITSPAHPASPLNPIWRTNRNHSSSTRVNNPGYQPSNKEIVIGIGLLFVIIFVVSAIIYWVTTPHKH